MSEKGSTALAKLSRFYDKFEICVNYFCVTLLTIQTISIIVMVFGRYIFNYVPRGTEEFALFCMVWFSLLSISLSIRNDGHIKMEIMDMLVKPHAVRYFKIFATLLSFGFGAYMIRYGIYLVQLTWKTILPGIRISQGWLYMSLPAAGLCICFASVMFFLEKLIRGKRHE